MVEPSGLSGLGVTTRCVVIDRRLYVARRFSLCFLHGGGAVSIFPRLLMAQ